MEMTTTTVTKTWNEAAVEAVVEADTAMTTCPMSTNRTLHQERGGLLREGDSSGSGQLMNRRAGVRMREGGRERERLSFRNSASSRCRVE